MSKWQFALKGNKHSQVAPSVTKLFCCKIKVTIWDHKYLQYVYITMWLWLKRIILHLQLVRVHACKHIHMCQHVCVIIQWQKEFSLLLHHGRLKQSVQHRMWEVKSSTHWGQGCLPEGPQHSSLHPTATATATAHTSLSKKSGRK